MIGSVWITGLLEITELVRCECHHSDPRLDPITPACMSLPATKALGTLKRAGKWELLLFFVTV